MNDRFITITLQKTENLKTLGHSDQAIALLEDALLLYPANTELRFQRSSSLFDAGRYDDVSDSLNDFLPNSKEAGLALFKIGCLLAGKGRYLLAKKTFAKAVAIDSSNAWAYNNLGLCNIELGNPQESYAALRRAVELKPDCAEFHNNFANLSILMFRLSESVHHYQLALELKPDYVEACANLARAYRMCGDNRALSLARRALELSPRSQIAVDVLMFSLNYIEQDPQIVFEEHKRWAPAAYHADPLLQPETVVKRDIIRVGYVSADFRSHPVATFFEPVLRFYDRSRFELFCYSQVSNPDATTEKLEKTGGVWRSIVGLTDGELAELIRRDGIDILVDLSGFTEGHRLGTFVLKPASIQCSWLGYPNTTGLSQIDYRITDEIADPPGMTDHLYTEKLIRLPHSFLCYTPGTFDLPLPCPTTPITFCCFNNLPKVSETLISLWAAILNELPESRLLMKSAFLADPQVCRMLLAKFEIQGIDPGRIGLRGFTATKQEHLELYGSCHIALDTYPYHGTTTTCEALWMGVPVISLAGKSHRSRVGASILTSVGCPELIATTPEEYVSYVVKLASNSKRLTHYRQSLRPQMQSSKLMNGESFVHDLECAYEAMLFTNL